MPDTIAWLLVALDLIAVGALAFATWRRYGIVFSAYNYKVYAFVFCLCLSLVALYQDRAWYALGIRRDAASVMGAYLKESLLINSLGFVTLAVVVVTFLRKRQDYKSDALRKSVGLIDAPAAHICFSLFALVFVVLCLVYNQHTFPLLNTARSFYVDQWFSPVYQGCTAAINIYIIYFGLRAVCKRTDVAWFVLSCLCSALTGARGGLFESLLVVAIVAIYLYRQPASIASEEELRGALVGRTWRILALVPVVILAALAMVSLRDQGSVAGVQAQFEELLYGNSFSDVRDGAFLLKGFRENLGDTFVYGRTYLAALISFIPSSLSPFRQQWAWGKLSAYGISHMQGVHLGLRGGWFMEPYINFGYVGVIGIALVYGAMLAYLDYAFYYELLLKGRQMDERVVFPLSLVATFAASLLTTSGFFTVYVILGMMLMMAAVTKVLQAINVRRDEAK